jgi:hypothetical protein
VVFADTLKVLVTSGSVPVRWRWKVSVVIRYALRWS